MPCNRPGRYRTSLKWKRMHGSAKVTLLREDSTEQAYDLFVLIGSYPNSFSNLGTVETIMTTSVVANMTCFIRRHMSSWNVLAMFTDEMDCRTAFLRHRGIAQGSLTEHAISKRTSETSERSCLEIAMRGIGSRSTREPLTTCAYISLRSSSGKSMKRKTWSSVTSQPSDFAPKTADAVV
jgi:hypothetical protein